MKNITNLLCTLCLALPAIGCVSGGGGGGNSAGDEDATAAPADSVASDDVGSVDIGSPELDTAPLELESVPAPFLTYSGGTCPEFKAGSNTFTSGSMERTVRLHIPNDPKGAGVTFLWHGFGDSTQNFSNAFNAQQMSNEAHMIIVTPEPAIPVPGMGFNSWSFLSFGDTTADITLFDDVLTCLEENFDINELTVYTMGFSAGALMSSKLLLERGGHLTAGVVFSGGTDAAGPDLIAIPYQKPGHKMPVLVAHGGQTDNWGAGPIIVKFNEGSIDLAERLTEDGHPVILCDHSGGHTVPQGGVGWAWEFIRTAYWSEGESQWIGHQGPPFPDYCTFPTELPSAPASAP